MLAGLTPWLDWLLYAQSRGQFQRLVGLAARYRPPCMEAYRKNLPAAFQIPARPLISLVIIDYLEVSPWPFARYQEAAILLRAAYRDREGWYPLVMPVTTWIARQGGHHIGFPKFVTPEIRLREEAGVVRGHASGVCGGRFAVDATFVPGLAGPTADWEEPFVRDPALFTEPFLVHKPVGIGPAVHEVRLEHVKPAAWESRPGRVALRGHEERLIPSTGPVLGTWHAFNGGMNLVSARLA